ncbi:hypothetical protein MT418_001162 [Batrachochytrium dendrobatidis]
MERLILQNATLLNMAVRSMGRTNEYGPLKVFFAIAQTLLIVVCSPIIIHERDQPMVKYRSWTINLAACLAITIRSIIDACTSMDGWVDYETLPFTFWLKNICLTITVCSYGPIYLRHYYLLRLPVLQTQLFNYETMVDPEKYKKLSRSLVRTKFLSSEAGAWMFFAINFIPLMGIGIYYLLNANFDEMAIGIPNPADLYMVKMCVSVIFISSLFVIWYGAGAPKENFHIMKQFYVVTVSSLITATVLLIGVTSGDLHTNRLCFAIAFVMTFLTLSVDILMPLQYLVTNQRYNTVVLSSSKKSKAHKRKYMGIHAHKMAGSNGVILSSETNVNDYSSTGSDSSSKINSQTSKKSGTYTIPKIIDSPPLRDAFCQYLAREFSLENLLFLETVRLYKEKVRQVPTIANVKQISDKIMTEFIAPNSVNEVNLPKKDVNKLTAALHTALGNELNVELALTVFDDAARHIEEMLALNHLRKFQASPLFENIVSV